VSKEPEEVERLLQAITAPFEAIEDDAECTAALSAVLRDWQSLLGRLRALRQDRVLALRAQELTWAQIAEIIGEVTPERAQQISKGHTGAARKKAKAERDAQAVADKPPTE
jgi:hypothetical protein